MRRLTNGDFFLLFTVLVVGHLFTPYWTWPVVVAREVLDLFPDQAARELTLSVLQPFHDWHTADGLPWVGLAIYAPFALLVNGLLARSLNQLTNTCDVPRR